MESILLISGGVVSLFVAGVIWKKRQEKKRTEMLRLYEEMERRRHIQQLSINWNAFQENVEKKRNRKTSVKTQENDFISPDVVELGNVLNKKRNNNKGVAI